MTITERGDGEGKVFSIKYLRVFYLQKQNYFGKGNQKEHRHSGRSDLFICSKSLWYIWGYGSYQT